MNGRAYRRSCWCALGKLASILLPVAALIPAHCCAQNVVDYFAPVADAKVNAVAVQTDGRVAVGGVSTMVTTQPRHGVARVNHDGSIDPTFDDPNADGPVDALFVQADGKIIIGGDFQHIGNQART